MHESKVKIDNAEDQHLIVDEQVIHAKACLFFEQACESMSNDALRAGMSSHTINAYEACLFF